MLVICGLADNNCLVKGFYTQWVGVEVRVQCPGIFACEMLGLNFFSIMCSPIINSSITFDSCSSESASSVFGNPS